MTGFQTPSIPITVPLILMTKIPLNVGLVKLGDDFAPKWGLIFMLDKCLQPNFKYPMERVGVKSTYLFGQIVEGLNALQVLSGASKTERSSYTFTLESRAV